MIAMDGTRPATASPAKRKQRRFTTSLLSTSHTPDAPAAWAEDADAMWLSQPHLGTVAETSPVVERPVAPARPGSMFVPELGGRTRSKWSFDGITSNVRTIARRASHSVRTHILSRHRRPEQPADAARPAGEEATPPSSSFSPSRIRRSSFFRAAVSFDPSSSQQQQQNYQLPPHSSVQAGLEASALHLDVVNGRTIARDLSFDSSFGAGAGARAAAAASRPGASQISLARPSSAFVSSPRYILDSAAPSSASLANRSGSTDTPSQSFPRHLLRPRRLIPWRTGSLHHAFGSSTSGPSKVSQALQSRSVNVSTQSRCDDVEGDYMCDSVVDLRKLDVAPPQPAIQKVDPVTMLPAEIMVNVLSHLDAPSLIQCALVSRRWHGLASARDPWKSAFLRKFRPSSCLDPPPRLIGGLGAGPIENRGLDYWRMYRARQAVEHNWKSRNVKAVYFNGHSDSVYCCQFDEDKLITGSRDKTIRVWSMRTYECLKVIGGPDYRPGRDPAGRVLPTRENPTTVSLPSANGTELGAALYHVPSTYHSASILCLQYDHEILVTGSSDCTCLVWDINTFQPIARLQHHAAGVLDVCIDSNYIVSCSKDSRICVWSRKTFKLVHTLSGHSGPVNAVQLRGNLLASASGDGFARLWNLDTMTCTDMFQSEQRGLATVEFSNDGRYILAGGNDQVIYKFDVVTSRCVHIFTGHNKLVRSLFLDSYNGRVISGSYDQAIRVFDFDPPAGVSAAAGTAAGTGAPGVAASSPVPGSATTGPASEVTTPTSPTHPDGTSSSLLASPGSATATRPARTGRLYEFADWTTSWILSTKSDYRRIVATSQDGRALLMDFGYSVPDVDLLREAPHVI